MRRTNDCSNPFGTSPAQTIRLEVTSQYEVWWTGASPRKTERGRTFKDGKTTDIMTLLTFTFPAEPAGKTCSFHFNLSGDSIAQVLGTDQFDVLTSLAPAAFSTFSWPPGNLRDQHIERMSPKAGGTAECDLCFPTFGQGFICPAGQTYGGELSYRLAGFF